LLGRELGAGREIATDDQRTQLIGDLLAGLADAADLD
jgi:hypothetical protein